MRMDPLLHGLIVACVLAALFHRGNLDRRRRALAIDGQRTAGTLVVAANSFSDAWTGLLNHASLAPREGLWLRGRSIHTRGMLFPIDVVFVDRQGLILKIVESIPPARRRVAGPRGTRATLELAAGAARREFSLTVGRKLELLPWQS